VSRACLFILLCHAGAACDPGVDDDVPQGNAAPIVSDQRIATLPDAAITIDGINGAYDFEHDPLTVSDPSAPAGHTAVLAGTHIVITPAPGFLGDFDVTWTVSDPTHRVTAKATVHVDTTPPIMALGGAVRVDGPTPVILGATGGSDATRRFAIVTQPASGRLDGVPPILIYTPRLNFYADDSFTYRAFDEYSSSTATFYLHVSSPQDPFAFDGAASGVADQSLAVNLMASSPLGAPLVYTIVSPPSLGSLSGTAPNLTYTPRAGVTGSDSFLFQVSDGTHSSNVAHFSLTVQKADVAPTALPQAVVTPEDTALEITLSGTDPDGDALFYTAETSPSHGTISGFGATKTYVPEANYHGTDSFTFSVADGHQISATATVSITVTSVDDPPSATAINIATNEDTPVNLTLRGTDADGDPITFAVGQPTNGTLSGTPPALIYTPKHDFNGSDSFTYTASAAGATSAPATVSIQVVAVNDPPVAASTTVMTTEDTDVDFTLMASDVDSFAGSLRFTVTSRPSDGFLIGSGANWTYLPADNATGTRTLTFVVNDGLVTSDPATVTITITPVNDPPVARDDYATTSPASPLTLDVLANDSDADGDVLTIDSITAPPHGVADIVDRHIVYTPDAGFTDVDVFSYTIVDAAGVTATAQVHIGIGSFPAGAPAEALLTIGNTTSAAPAISGDGRFIAFESNLALVSGDTNGVSDIYVYDRNTRSVSRVSASTTGGPANGPSTAPQLSTDGRYVVFTSRASNLVDGDTNSAADVFRHDRTTGETVRVSVTSAGGAANGDSSEPQVSADGNTIAFTSLAFNLADGGGDTNGMADVFVHDVAAGTTTRVSVPNLTSLGTQGDQGSTQPAISSDGRYVAFSSLATNLVSDDRNGVQDIFVRDLTAATTSRISVTTVGSEANGQSSGPAISANGKIISFVSLATNLVPPTSAVQTRIYVRDLTSQITTRPSTGAFGWARLSGDGHYLAAATTSTNTAGALFDRLAGTSATLGFGFSWFAPVLSGNGRYVATYDLNGTGRLIIAPNPL
jgi:Tol biopolymer transport system component